MTTPTDGRLTSLSTLSGALTGTELMYIVSPGNAALGNSFNVTLNTLLTFFSGSGLNLTSALVTSGSAFNAPTNISKVLVNKSVGSATQVILPAATTLLSPFFGVFIKDLKGDANIHNITITFTGGETCDGASSIVIDAPFGWAAVCPVPSASAWYQSQ